MVVVIFFLKIFISIIIGYLIFSSCRIQDTSMLQAISLNDKGLVNKIFSPKQLKDIEISFKKLFIPYNTLSVLALIGIGIVIGIAVFFICEYLFPLKSISFIIACPLVLSPFWIIKYISNKEQEKLESGLNDFFIQLKSALNITPDIIEALRRIQNLSLEPFLSYTKQLLREINTGKLPELALEGFSQKINIKKFTFYMNNVRYCQMYGGDIITLTEKTQDTISKAIKEKRKRVKETKSICTILYLLIAIDIYMYFAFIGCNQYYLDVMINSFWGRVILNINFISIWGIVWLSKAVRRFDY